MVCFTLQISAVIAQCPMCKASVESNIKGGDTVVGMGLNDGILYLMALPYMAVALIAYLWYRAKKKQEKLYNGIA